MTRFLIVMLLMISTTLFAAPPKIRINTNLGPIIVELYPEKAPKTVENFLNYVNEGFYNGTIFHRVIANFMIQGGGFDQTLTQKPTKQPIENEAANGLKNEIGTIAMARTNQPHSATAQFFINVANNSFLNHTAPTIQGYGYTVFGKVTEGMEVVNKIAATPTGPKGMFASDVPKNTIVIESIELLADSPDH
ncbi:peptidylprolyl isomerase [Nitrosomonas communis]|uniref:Peptidyl-prolyl cis-trans isomerase n=1 Tax=Nitrosomonas communis TaxID=44574 RepID=A0A1H2PY43_9PROT|nr:peptidylprolyl isomerase [Nitrosomonas communis]SDV99761.1 peptidyl-prolyl cis-trans isomerase A (cyclophilin A)/peptidyl-prolyl cis-trans isomerase B (cyclophilin B) [Nitrosomonas communis]